MQCTGALQLLRLPIWEYMCVPCRQSHATPWRFTVLAFAADSAPFRIAKQLLDKYSLARWQGSASGMQTWHQVTL